MGDLRLFLTPELERLRELFLPSDDMPSAAGISGGRTSGLMGAMLSPATVLSFQNTSEESRLTYDFVARLEDAYQRPIRRLEWRPPPRKGDPPRLFRYALVDHKDLARKGVIFRAMLEAVNDYRREQGKGIVAPWARSRICTAYMKHRVMNGYLRDTWRMVPKEKSEGAAKYEARLKVTPGGIPEAFESFVGLRADEPVRVHDLHKSRRGEKYYRTPLAQAAITKQDVNAFWSRQPFNLELNEPYGNCSGCFLKDQADLARLMNDPECNPDFWIGMQRDFPGFGGMGRPSYAQLQSEGPARLTIEAAIRRGDVPANDGSIPARRFKFVVIQERKRVENGPEGISCACEKSAVEDDEEADQLALAI